MKFEQALTLESLASQLNRKFIGDASFLVKGINEIHRVQEGDVCFVDHPKYYDKCLNSAASIIIIDKEVECPEGKALIISPTPAADFNKINLIYNPFIASKQSISDSAVIGEDTIIQPNVFIGHNVTIGKNCIIHAGASIMNDSIIGDNVIIGMNTVIGADAFYFKKTDKYNKFHTVGNVIIEDNVEIGASSTIDRGLTADTRISEGAKLDNQVHIGHDTQVGKNCLFAAGVAIAGCCIIEEDVMLWGQVGISSSITIGKGAIVLAKSGVSKSLPGGKTYFGYPAGEMNEYYRQMAFQRREYKKSLK